MEGIYESLRGKRVLVTGSSRGIGRAIAEGFAKNGCDVAVHGVEPSAHLESLTAELSSCGGKIITVCGDLADPTVPAKLIAGTVEALGGLDILVSNVSVQIRKPWMEVTDEEMRLQTEINFFAGIRLIQQAVPHMLKEGWGRVITIGSAQQERPHPDMLVYSATKAAMRNVAQSIALQVADKNITVNNIAVGTIYTDRNMEALSDPEYLEKVKNNNPVKFIGEPTDCVGTVLLLASEAGRYITGDNIHVDGGRTIS
ncbi:MAG: SDR family oxidoreductase [Ruminococcaceae bacterium]|nr:SDR family oxidoreductase [Oscillospiraceae bacterium]